MPILTNIGFKQILEEEGKAFIKSTQESVRKHYPHNDYIRGAADTLRQEETDNTLSIFGWQYFENVEQGIPPLVGKVKKSAIPPVRVRLYDWSISVGIPFDKDYQRKSFAFMLRRKILFEGTQLYRNGGRKDIYTPEMDKMVENIKNKVGKQIISQRFV